MIDLEYSLKDGLFWSKSMGVKNILLIIENEFINTESLTAQLIDYDNWAYHYFISYTETKLNKNILFVSFFDDSNFDIKNDKKMLKIDNIKDIFIYEDLIFDLDFLVDVFLKNVNWDLTDLNKHSLVWSKKTQKLVAEFVDFMLGNLGEDFPKHWYGRDFKENSQFINFNNDKFVESFNKFLKENKNLEIPENILKWEFTKTYKIN